MSVMPTTDNCHPLQHPHQPGSEKLYRRARRSLDSSYVEQKYMQDVVQKGNYFVKCIVGASMKSKSYRVHFALSVASGSVIYAECGECGQSSLGRCSHTIAALLFVSRHLQTCGSRGKTYCAWYHTRSSGTYLTGQWVPIDVR